MKNLENNCTITINSEDKEEIEKLLLDIEMRQPLLTVYGLLMDSDIYIIQVTAITVSDFEKIVEFYLEQGFTVFTTEGAFVYDEEAD